MHATFFKSPSDLRTWLEKNHAAAVELVVRTIAWWVMSAQQEDTRDRRLARLIASSAAEKRLT